MREIAYQTKYTGRLLPLGKENNKMELELGKESINKLLLKYSVPAIIGMVVVSLYNAVDRIFIGYIENVGALA